MSGCECKNTKCVDSRPTMTGYIKRRRRCLDCGRRFSTVEVEVVTSGGPRSTLANLREKFGGMTKEQQRAVERMITAFLGDK